MKARAFFKSSVIVLAFFCLSPLVKAQTDPGDGGPDPDPGTSAPLDLGITTLVAVGIGYAVKKRYDLKKNKVVDNTGE